MIGLPLFGGGESTLVLEVIDRLEQIILSHTGEDVFDEVLKLLVAKLYDEETSRTGGRFRSYANPDETSRVLRELFRGALEHWPGIFPDGQEYRLPAEVLHTVARELVQIHLKSTSLSILDAVLERLIARSSKGAMGQYFTPRNVVSLAVDVVAPQRGEIVLDPACGSAGFLLTAIRQSQVAGNGPAKAVGFDFDIKAFRIAKIMGSIVGGGNVVLSRRNSLDPDGVDLDGDATFSEHYSSISGFHADVIVTNPPFGGDITNYDLLTRYESAVRCGRVVSKMPRELLFVERCVQMLKPGGRAAIVVPQGIVANGSAAPFRAWLRERCRLLGVVGLHPFAFLPHTGVKTSLLFIEKRGNERTEDPPVFFAVNRQPGKDSAGRFLVGDGSTCYGNGDDLRSIATAFRAHLASIGREWAKFDDVAESGETTSAVVPADDVWRADRCDAEYFDAGVLETLAKLRRCAAKPLRLHVAARVPGWKKRNGGTIDYVDISSVDNRTGQMLPAAVEAEEAPSRASYRIAPGDVLVSTVRPERNSVGLVTESGQNDLVATNGFCVLRPQDISPELLFAFCKTKTFKQLVARCATATMYPAVSDDDVLDVPLPPIPPEVSAKVETAIRSAHEQLAAARRLIAEAVGTLDDHISDVIANAASSASERLAPRP